MKAVILAGGLGTRITEETHLKPKPMIEIGGRPILWHIMKIYSFYGINDFIICCGYKGYMIKEYFANYFLHMSDVTFDMTNNHMEVRQNNSEPWTVTLVNTGEKTMTGGRLKRVGKYLENDESFCFTYGDGVSNVNISELINFHDKHGKSATLIAVQTPNRYGALKIGEEDFVDQFQEKPQGEGSWVNGGFFILNKEVINRIANDKTIWEKEPLYGLVEESELVAYKHHGFWQSMDTLREKNFLNELWDMNKAPWKVW